MREKVRWFLGPLVWASAVFSLESEAAQTNTFRLCEELAFPGTNDDIRRERTKARQPWKQLTLPAELAGQAELSTKVNGWAVDLYETPPSEEISVQYSVAGNFGFAERWKVVIGDESDLWVEKELSQFVRSVPSTLRFTTRSRVYVAAWPLLENDRTFSYLLNAGAQHVPLPVTDVLKAVYLASTEAGEECSLLKADLVDSIKWGLEYD